MDRQKTVELKAKREPEDEKDGNGIYRNCLVCGDNNYRCGWFIIGRKNKKLLENFQANALELDFKSVIHAE
jgi:hypothetical protein